jgi:hypothetical protein
MRNDSSLNYNTSLSKIQNFKDFEQNIRKEKDTLKKVRRGYKKNVDGSNIANVDSDKLKYNKITHKTDNNFGKELVDDFITNLDDEVKDTDHKYKMEKTQDKAKMESYETFVQKKMIAPSDYSDDTNVTSYMFFGNLQTIHRLGSEILKMDQNKINQSLDNGHNWAEDHITTAKVQISQVYNFLQNKSNNREVVTNEDHQYNYMFFSNLETICEQCEDMLKMNENEVDEILVNGHDWAEDHISSAKENVEQVHDFLTNEVM